MSGTPSPNGCPGMQIIWHGSLSIRKIKYIQLRETINVLRLNCIQRQNYIYAWMQHEFLFSKKNPFPFTTILAIALKWFQSKPCNKFSLKLIQDTLVNQKIQRYFPHQLCTDRTIQACISSLHVKMSLRLSDVYISPPAGPSQEQRQKSFFLEDLGFCYFRPILWIGSSFKHHCQNYWQASKY